jgi:hypothetical protein
VYFIATNGKWEATFEPCWSNLFEYELRKSAKHPDNIKPKKKLIDWSKMPRGTMTSFGELTGTCNGLAYVAPDYSVTDEFDFAKLRLAEQTQFTYWGGGKCPVPEGVVVEVVLRQWNAPNEYTSPENVGWSHDNFDGDIIAYRIISLADGWTDNPGEAMP